MPEPDKSIRDALATYGGLIEDLSSTGPVIGKVFVKLTDSIRTGNPYIADGVHIHLVANDSFNAVATTRDGHDIVGIFVGAMIELFQLMQVLLTDPHYWARIGESASSSSNTRMSNFSLKERRLVFAAEAAFWGLHFILVHELGHIARGHLRYISHAFSETSLTELSYGRGQAIPARILRTIEMDADTIGTTSLVLAWLQLKHANSPLTHSDIIRARLFGVAAVFALIAQREDPTNPTESLTHPRPHLRMLLVLDRARNLATESSPSHEHVLDEAGSECITELSKCFPDFWRGSAWHPKVVRTSEIKRLFDDVRRLEPEFITLADERLAKYGHA